MERERERIYLQHSYYATMNIILNDTLCLYLYFLLCLLRILDFIISTWSRALLIRNVEQILLSKFHLRYEILRDDPNPFTRRSYTRIYSTNRALNFRKLEVAGEKCLEILRAT